MRAEVTKTRRIELRTKGCPADMLAAGPYQENYRGCSRVSTLSQMASIRIACSHIKLPPPREYLGETTKREGYFPFIVTRSVAMQHTSYFLRLLHRHARSWP